MRLSNSAAFLFSSKSVPLYSLNQDSLQAIYEGMPFRYNSVVDFAVQPQSIRREVLERTGQIHCLSYWVLFVESRRLRLPILDCLQIDGQLGGMLSSYLHDLDREMIEGSGEIKASPLSKLIWSLLNERFNYSFVFPSSASKNSRTSEYMSQIGFREEPVDELRSFYTGNFQARLFLPVMREFVSAIHQKNDIYSFDLNRFEASKPVQALTATTIIPNLFLESLHET